MVLDDLNKECSPSYWSKRFKTSEEVLNNHIKFITEETKNNVSKYKCGSNIKYGPGPMQLMDIYYKNKEEGTPIFVYIHGGYWQELNKDVSAYCVAPLVENGFRVIVLDYDLCPKVTLEEIVNEIKVAAKAILEYANKTSSSGISLGGHSAGAHLIACLLEKYFIEIPHNNLIKSIFLISGIYDLTELWKVYAVNPNNILSLNDETAKNLSPIFYNFKHLQGKNIKIFIYAAENDSPTFIKQSHDFYKKLQSYYDNNLIYKIVSECDHFDIVENLNCDNYEITQSIINSTI